MRLIFAETLLEEMDKRSDIFVLTGDLGYGVLDKVRETHPTRFRNCRCSEFAMLGIAVGLHYEGFIPVVYSITPFTLYRPFEMIRNYVNHEKIPVKLIGAGRGEDYGKLGFSHYASDAKQVLNVFENIETYFPESEEAVPDTVRNMLYTFKPSFLSLRR